jgi:hypothetical protein
VLVQDEFVTIMAELRQKIFDVRAWQSIECLEAQSSVFCDTRTINLKYINDDLRTAKTRRFSLIRLLDGISPGQLPGLTLEVLGLVKWPQDMGDHYASVNEG